MLRGRLTTAARDCGGGPVRGYAREKKIPWTRGVRGSKQDHRVVAEHDLRPGKTQHARVGAVNAGGMRGNSGGGGVTWGK
jgi:hypothetical protein